MTHVKKSIVVNVPLQTAYNQWTQFEEFPKFMDGVEHIKQLDDRRLHWRVNIFGHKEEYDAEIYEQMPDQVIAWRSVGGPHHAGRVSFRAVNSHTEVTLEMEYEPEGLAEKVGDMLGLMNRRVEHDLENFKKFIESMGHETGAWRGEIHGEDVDKAA